MNLRSGIFTLVAVAACMYATELNAQIIPRGNGQLVLRAARTYASRTIPGVGVGRFVAQRAGAQFGGGQGFRAATPRLGTQFGTGSALQAGRLLRRW